MELNREQWRFVFRAGLVLIVLIFALNLTRPTNNTAPALGFTAIPSVPLGIPPTIPFPESGNSSLSNSAQMLPNVVFASATPLPTLPSLASPTASFSAPSEAGAPVSPVPDWLLTVTALAQQGQAFNSAPAASATPMPSLPSSTPNPPVLPVGLTIIPPTALPLATAQVNLAPSNGLNTPLLNAPSSSASPSWSSSGQTYTVQAGDNLFRIAMRYGLTADVLAQANGISDPTLIVVGQVLNIPSLNTPAPLAPTSDSGLSLPQTPVDPAQAVNPTAETLVLSQNPALGILSPTHTPVYFVPLEVNGVLVDEFSPLPLAVQERIRATYALGQSLGRNPRAFSKLGDSTIENPHFLARFDESVYNLGTYSYLQSVIDHFRGSFNRDSIAVFKGNHAWTVLDAFWAGGACMANESPLSCEIRLHNPSYLFIRLGSNDVGVPDSFERSMREIISYSLEQGIVPMIGTKPDRHEGSNINNEILLKIAQDYQIPLWDFDRVATTLIDKGLVSDGVHLSTFYAHDYSQVDAFRRGHSLQNLTALIVLDRVWRIAESQ